MRSLGFANGKIIDLNEAAVVLEDRGYQFGDGIYEVTRVYNGKCFALAKHIERAYRSLRQLKIPAVHIPEEFTALHQLLIDESGLREAAVYMQITRGAAPRGHGLPETVVPCLTMTIRPAAADTQLQTSGVKTIFIPDERWLRCDIKSLNLLGNILGKQTAKEAGCFEAIQTRDGLVTEGTSSNFFIIKDGILWTHPANHLILNGITRSILIETILPSLNLTVLEKAFTPQFAQTADECFLSGTTTEIMPVISLNGTTVSNGQPGHLTQKIQQAYQALIIETCGSN